MSNEPPATTGSGDPPRPPPPPNDRGVFTSMKVTTHVFDLVSRARDLLLLRGADALPAALRERFLASMRDVPKNRRNRPLAMSIVIELGAETLLALLGQPTIAPDDEPPAPKKGRRR